MQQQILLIDDSKQIHSLVTSLLGEEPVQISSAFDAQYGLTLAASLRPDLILLDVEMPGINGHEACRRLKADPATATIPIIFLTARASTDEVVRGLNLGAIDYVTKPFKLSEMLSRVRAALRTSRLIRLLEEEAMIDSMTGLGNRAMFDERFEAEVALRIKSGNPLSCIALDVDQFKFINETYGRSFGDYVLSEIGAALTDTCRVEDIICHLEGERFAAILPYSLVDEAAELAEQMRVAIADIPFSKEEKSFSVTASFGVSRALHTYDRSLLERAHWMANRSKHGGGNRVLVDATQPPAVSGIASQYVSN
jgi:diguanylate cyclase (GGDEF)-like protein